MPKTAAEKPRGAAAPVTPIQKGSFTMRKRNFNINVRVTEGEKKRLKRAAKHYGISLSEYLRKVGLNKNLTEKPSRKLYEVYASVNDLRSNLYPLDGRILEGKLSEIEQKNSLRIPRTKGGRQRWRQRKFGRLRTTWSAR